MTAVIPTQAEGVFKNLESADKAVADLQQAGFTQDKILVSERQEVLAAAPPLPTRATAEGGVLGFMAGILLGMAAVTIAVGLFPEWFLLESRSLMLAFILGALAGGIVGAMGGIIVGFFVRRPNWKERIAEIHRILVTVQAGNRYNEAVKILRRHGALGSGKPLV